LPSLGYHSSPLLYHLLCFEFEDKGYILYDADVCHCDQQTPMLPKVVVWISERLKYCLARKSPVDVVGRHAIPGALANIYMGHVTAGMLLGHDEAQTYAHSGTHHFLQLFY
jgi:hypothetical protein